MGSFKMQTTAVPALYTCTFYNVTIVSIYAICIFLLQVASIGKAINKEENPTKIKHVRSILFVMTKNDGGHAFCSISLDVEQTSQPVGLPVNGALVYADEQKKLNPISRSTYKKYRKIYIASLRWSKGGV